MAFNPFDFFRTNQKILFAGITVVIMFVFVLSIGGGRGDFFNWFPEMLRNKRSTGEVMAVIDGKDVKESNVSDLRRNRTYANQYMVLAQGKALENLNRFAMENLKKVSPENQMLVQRALFAEQDGLDQFRQQFGSQLGQRADQLYYQFRAPQVIQGAFQMIQMLAAKPNLKPDDREVIEAVRKIIQIRLTANADRHYFLDTPNKTTRDELEFMLWLKKADSLGIRFRDEDVDTMVSQEFLQFPASDREKIFSEMMSEQRQRPITRSNLYKALADEFRVRTAMIAVLGPQESRGVEGINPFDLYEFFRKETSYARYGVIGFPVENFLDKVVGEPTEQELKKLFDQTRNTEPNPGDAKPGIKEPRKLKINFLEATGKEPFYTAAGADALLKTELHGKLAGLLSVPVGPSTAGLFAAPSILALPEPALQASYRNYQEDQKLKLSRRWFPSPFGEPNNVPMDASLVNVTTVFSAAGLGAASPIGTPAAILGIPGSMIAVAESTERKARLNFGFPMFAPPLLDGLAGLADVASAWAVQGMGLPQPLPLSAVKPMLAKEMNELMRYKVAQTDLQNFHDEWMKLATPKDKASAEQAEKEAAEYVAKFTGTQPWKDKDGKEQLGRGLKVSGSADFRDQYDMVNDPGLAPLAKLWKPTSTREFKDPATFSRPFFNTTDPMTGAPVTGLNKPILDPQAFGQVPTPNDLSPVYIAWRTADQPAEAPRVLDDKAKAKVLAVWKRQQAKELAKKAADELAKQFDGKLGGNAIEISQKLTSARTEFANKNFAAQPLREKVAQFEIPDPEDRSIKGVGAAIVTEQPSRQTGESTFGLQPFQLNPSSAIPYATPRMTAELVANRNKPLSTAFTMLDAPENMVYVAVLADRNEEGALRFNSIVYNPNPKIQNSVARDISERFLLSARQNARQLAVEMLKAEYGYEKENPELDKKYADSSN
jgi:hypothetical protein